MILDKKYTVMTGESDLKAVTTVSPVTIAIPVIMDKIQKVDNINNDLNNLKSIPEIVHFTNPNSGKQAASSVTASSSGTKSSEEIKKDLNELLKECRKHFPEYDEQLISKAYHFCVESHKNSMTKYNEPYYKIPLALAYVLVNDIPLDQTSVICALLYKIPENSSIYNSKVIRSEFGKTVGEIVDGLRKIQHIESQNIESFENYRKLLLSLFKDVRIILIKIAEMLENMRKISKKPISSTRFIDMENQNSGISFFDGTEAQDLAKEALEIYAPFAQRFGLSNLKCELEDIAFSITNPDDYFEIKQKVNLSGIERKDYIKNFTKPIKHTLENDELFKKNGIKFEINGRAKHIYSIFNKRIARGLPIEELNDLFAIRVIIDSEDINYCYLTYGIITNIYDVVPGTFKNYIANPKKNGYKSIHAAVKGTDGSPVEVQIRTREMHNISEKGVASHFNYKRGFLPAQSILDDENIEEWMNIVKSVFEKPVALDKRLTGNSLVSRKAGDFNVDAISRATTATGGMDELLDSLRKNWFSDEIYLFTPAKEFKIFPKDATPLDFAYKIHLDIGNHCIGAKVNGKVVPMDHKLQSGDQVEILTSKNQKPKNEWLDKVVTARAKSSIQKFLKDQLILDEENGKQIWHDFLSKFEFKVSDKKLLKITKLLKFDSTGDFFTALSTKGFDKELSIDYIKWLIESISKPKKQKNEKIKVEQSLETNSDNEDMVTYDNNNHNHSSKGAGEIINFKTTNVNFSKCCYPIPGDHIVGKMSENGKSVEIHRNKCLKILQYMQNKKTANSSVSFLFDLDWDRLTGGENLSKLVITGDDRTNILSEITSCISKQKELNIRGISFNAVEDGFKGQITLTIPDHNFLSRLKDDLLSIQGVKSVKRYLEDI